MSSEIIVHGIPDTNNSASFKHERPVTYTEVQAKRGLDTVSNDGFISTANSSETVISGTESFTGTAEDVSRYSTISVFVDSDQNGTLKMQLSSDGTNWDRSKNVPVDQAISTGSVHTLEVVSQYFRIVYVNGGTDQTHFRLQTIFHAHRSGFLTSSSDEIISKINDAQVVRVANDPYLDISRGLYADKFAFHRFGYNPTVPNGSFADIWTYGPSDATYNWPTTDEKFRVKAGGNAADDAAGAGARTIQIQYLDANGDEQQDQLTLDGSSVSTSTSVAGRRVIRAWVDTVGAIKSNNTGQIIIENETSGQVVAAIAAGVGQTELSMYTVPLGYTAYLTRVQVNVSVGTNKDADVKMWQRQDAYTTSAPFGSKRLVRQWVAVQGADNIIKYESHPTFPALTDLWFEAQGNGAATSVDIDYDLILVKDEAPVSPQ
jgi:hypothetical protein